MRSNLLDMQKSRLVAKRRKPAFRFRVMVANRTAVWLGGRQSQLAGVVAGRLCRSMFYRVAPPRFGVAVSRPFLGGYRALDASDIVSCAELSMFGVASAWTFMLGVAPCGLFACGLLVRFRIMQAPSYDRLISAIFLGRFTWVSLIIKAFFKNAEKCSCTLVCDSYTNPSHA